MGRLGYLRPLTPAYLTQILETILNSIILQGFPPPPQSIPADQLIKHLDMEHEYPQIVISQVLPWFGSVSGNEWTMDPHAVVREIGLGRLRFPKVYLDFYSVTKDPILMRRKDDPANLNTFIEAWKTAVGDSFDALVNLRLLEVGQSINFTTKC